MALKLPPDPDQTNDLRADWANSALVTFMDVTKSDPPDMLSDLITDLMHWCDRNGQNFETELTRARGNYHEETLPDL